MVGRFQCGIVNAAFRSHPFISVHFDGDLLRHLKLIFQIKMKTKSSKRECFSEGGAIEYLDTIHPTPGWDRSMMIHVI